MNVYYTDTAKRAGIAFLFATDRRLRVNPIDSPRSIAIPYLSSPSVTAVSYAAASPLPAP